MFPIDEPELLPFQRHSPTSQAAATSMKSHAASQRETVYRAIRTDPDGLTDEQIERATGLLGNTVRPRRVELAREGRICAKGTRKTSSGRSAVVWVIKERA